MMQSHQELLKDERYRRLFCEIMESINYDTTLINHIFLTDEATFVFNGEVNQQNCR